MSHAADGLCHRESAELAHHTSTCVLRGEAAASLQTGGPAPTFTFTAPSGSYYARLHGLNGAVRSDASNEIRLHINVPVAPSAPANLLGLVNGSALALAWTNAYAGGVPTSLMLDVTGSITTSIPIGLSERFDFAGVPAGTYTRRCAPSMRVARVRPPMR